MSVFGPSSPWKEKGEVLVWLAVAVAAELAGYNVMKAYRKRRDS